LQPGQKKARRKPRNSYIEYAKKKVEEKYETGFYFDIHGFDEGRPWIQLGYLVGGREFNDLSDEELNKHFIKARSSIKYLAENGNKSFAELTRGRASLGALLENEGYDVVPSPENSGPGHSGTYYNGGYNTARHGSRDKGKINAIQVETPRYGIRDTKENRKKFAGTFAGILEKYVIENMKIDLK
jgi:hypothetical protein